MSPCAKMMPCWRSPTPTATFRPASRTSSIERCWRTRRLTPTPAFRSSAKVDEIPFDFQRRIMSVVVRTPEGRDLIISKGAPEAIFPRCAAFELDGQLLPMDHAHIVELGSEYERLSADGFRVLAIATKEGPPRTAAAGHDTPYGKADECDLILQGYIAFLDPPKETCAAAIADLQGHGDHGQGDHR